MTTTTAVHDIESCRFAHCVDCGLCHDRPGVELYLVCADFGQGAFLRVMCPTCEHRAWYRGQLLMRLREQRTGSRY